MRLAVIVAAALTLGPVALAAQAKKATPVRDSMKALKKDLKADKAEIKAAKKAGDSTKVKKLSKDLKADKAKRDSLKKRAEAKKGVVPMAPPKKP
jgi:uncharacterized membrane protein (DUF106 family)